MKQSTLNDLYCPYCGSGLELVSEIDTQGEEIVNGIVKCNCRKYPLVEGILALRTSNLNAMNQALSAMEKNKPAWALFELLMPHTTASRILQAAKHRDLPFSAAIERFRSNIFHHYLNRTLKANSFSSIINHIKFISFGGYFKYRFCSASFIAGIPLIFLMNYFPGPILEIGCGMGHHGFIISQLYPQRRLVSVDSSFFNLYLAKRFFLPQAEYICLDANDPLPFPDQSFNAIFTSDLFHYLHSKKLAMQEIARISTDNTVILLSHLHKLAGAEPVAGEPLTASGWLNLACLPQVRLFPETQVFKNFLTEDKLDLLYQPAEEEIEEADAFTLVGAFEQGAFRVYEGINKQFFNLRRHLVINPLYRVSSKNNKVILQKRWPSEFMQAENRNIDRILPDTLSLDRQFLREIAEGEFSKLDIDFVDELMKKFILINVPQNY